MINVEKRDNDLYVINHNDCCFYLSKDDFVSLHNQIVNVLQTEFLDNDGNKKIDEIIVNMLQLVKSSQIEKIGYNSEDKILYVKFHSGALYKYLDVEKSEYEELLKSESTGKAFAIFKSKNLGIKLGEGVWKIK